VGNRCAVRVAWPAPPRSNREHAVMPVNRTTVTFPQLRELNGRKVAGVPLAEMSRSARRSSYGPQPDATEGGHTVPNRSLTSPRCCFFDSQLPTYPGRDESLLTCGNTRTLKFTLIVQRMPNRVRCLAEYLYIRLHGNSQSKQLRQGCTDFLHSVDMYLWPKPDHLWCALESSELYGRPHAYRAVLCTGADA
jgi:hypothetical protein